MSAVPVIPLTEVVAALEEGQVIAKLVMRPLGKDGKVKIYQAGTYYVDIKYSIRVNVDGKEVVKTCNGDFSFTDVKTGRPPLNKDDPNDKRNEYVQAGKEPTYMIATDTRKGGALARFHELFDPQLEQLVKDAAEGPNKLPGFITNGRTYHHLIQTRIQDEQSEKFGEKIDTPLVRIKVHPEAQESSTTGRPTTEYLDRDTKKVVAGRYVYEPCYCLDDEGQPIMKDGKKVLVTASTLCHYLTPNSIVDGRINAGTLAISKGWVSAQIKATRLIIKRGSPLGTLYEDELADEPDTVVDDKSSTPSGSKPVISADKVADFLNDLNGAEDELA